MEQSPYTESQKGPLQPTDSTPAFQAKPTTFGLIYWKITQLKTLRLRAPQDLVGTALLWAHYTIAMC